MTITRRLLSVAAILAVLTAVPAAGAQDTSFLRAQRSLQEVRAQGGGGGGNGGGDNTGGNDGGGNGGGGNDNGGGGNDGNNDNGGNGGGGGGGNNGFCATTGLQLSDGTQIRTGACSETVQGAIPRVENMVSTRIIAPESGAEIEVGESFTISVKTRNMELGFFSDPQQQYYASPQNLNAQGIIQGHQHVVLEELNGNENTDPTAFKFFKGLDGQPQGGVLSTVVPGLQNTGQHRICTMTGSLTHQPVIMPVAQRGSQDDCIRINVVARGTKGQGGNDNGGDGAADAQQGGNNDGADGQQQGANNGGGNQQQGGNNNGDGGGQQQEGNNNDGGRNFVGGANNGNVNVGGQQGGQAGTDQEVAGQNGGNNQQAGGDAVSGNNQQQGGDQASNINTGGQAAAGGQAGGQQADGNNQQQQTGGGAAGNNGELQNGGQQQGGENPTGANSGGGLQNGGGQEQQSATPASGGQQQGAATTPPQGGAAGGATRNFSRQRSGGFQRQRGGFRGGQ